jgi:hypothetical protein
MSVISSLYNLLVSNANDIKDFMAFLSFTFRDRPGSALIAQRDIWLFTPALNTDKWWYLLTDSDWSSIVRPGSRLEMSFNLSSSVTKGHARRKRAPIDSQHGKKIASLRNRNSCPDCRHLKLSCILKPQQLCHHCSQSHSPLGRSSPFSQVRFSTPMPPWAMLPDDLEFRWM